MMQVQLKISDKSLEDLTILKAFRDLEGVLSQFNTNRLSQDQNKDLAI